MSRIDTWLGASSKASDHAAIIADKSSSIVLVRGVTPLAAQTVRIEEQRGNRQAMTPAGTVFQIDALVFGYRDHATITDTDIKPGDRFAFRGVRFEVIMLAVNTVGSVQAYCKLAG